MNLVKEPHFLEGKILAEMCLAPTIIKNMQPVSENDYAAYKSTLDQNLNNLINFIQATPALLTYQDEPSDFMTVFLVVVSEQFGEGDWTTDSIYLKDKLKFLFDNFNVCNEDMIQHCSLAMLNFIQPKLKRDTWKNNPASIASLKFTTDLLTRYSALNDEAIQIILPPALLMIDDFETDNKIVGLNVLQNLLQHIDKSLLMLFGRSDVIFHALKPLLLLRDHLVVKLAIICISEVLGIQDPSGNIGPEWTRSDDTLQMVIDRMQIESSLTMKQVYVETLPNLLRARDPNDLFWSRKLPSVFEEYLDDCVMENQVDEILVYSTVKCIVTTLDYCKPFSAAFDQLVDKIFLTMVRILLIDDAENKYARSLKALQVGAGLLMLYTEKTADKVRNMLETDTEGLLPHDQWWNSFRLYDYERTTESHIQKHEVLHDKFIQYCNVKEDL